MAKIFAYITHKDGNVDDSAFELISAAQKIDSNADITAVVSGSASQLDGVCNQLKEYFKEVYKIDHEAMAYPNAEVIRKALVSILPENSIVLLSHNTFAIDLGPGLSIKMDSAYISDVVDIQGLEGSTLRVTRQEYGGLVSTQVNCDLSEGICITVRPGSFPENRTMVTGSEFIDKTEYIGDISAGRKYLKTVVQEVGDVDITKSDVLVAVGRGIEDEENLEIAEVLAQAMRGDIACSRPIVDTKWLNSSRQVGTSGQTVKPKVYMAMGISGSFQHMGGIKGSPFIVAVNKNPKAPIFQAANVGVVADCLEFMPLLTGAIKDLK